MDAMQITEIPFLMHDWTRFTDRRVVREFFRWRAWSATAAADGRLAIILEEYVRGRITICWYRSADERAKDLRVLLEIEGRGGAGWIAA